MEQALPVTEALSPPASRAWYAGLKESLNLLDDEPQEIIIKIINRTPTYFIMKSVYPKIFFKNE